MLKSLSSGEDDAGVHEKLGASKTNDGYLSARNIQKLSGSAFLWKAQCFEVVIYFSL